jgi:hypothetical protein
VTTRHLDFQKDPCARTKRCAVWQVNRLTHLRPFGMNRETVGTPSAVGFEPKFPRRCRARGWSFFEARDQRVSLTSAVSSGLPSWAGIPSRGG